jgi:hypothetical protein
VLPETILRPEVQDPKVFAEGIETIVSTNKRVAEAYISDGRSGPRPAAAVVGRPAQSSDRLAGLGLLAYHTSRIKYVAGEP